MEQVINILPGLQIVIDTDKFEALGALQLAELPAGDYQIGLDMTLTNILEKTEQKVQALVILRSK